MAVLDYWHIIDDAARAWNVDPAWVAAVMEQESGGHATDARGNPIRGTSGEGGLMQIMPGTARALGVTDVDDPPQAIFGGAKYLSQLLDRYQGDTVRATAAYNAGPNRIGLTGPIPNLASYVQPVTANYQRFKPLTRPAAPVPASPAPAPAASPPPSPSDSE